MKTVELTEDEAIHIIETQKIFCETYSETGKAVDEECADCKSIKAKLFKLFPIPDYLK